MNRSETNPSTEMAAPSMLRRGTADLEPFNGSREMFTIRDSFDERMPTGPSKVIFTARVDRDSMWTSTIKIAVRGQRR